jgi:hypothetical protein
LNDADTDRQDAEVIQMAVDALNDAQRRAIKSGRTVILVVNGELVRFGPAGAGRVVLKKLPPRRRVSVRTQRASK